MNEYGYYAEPDRPQSKPGCLAWVIGAIVVAVIIGYCSTDSSESSSGGDAVYNSVIDASVWQVKKFLKEELLKDPGSYEGIEWSQVNENSDGTYWVRHKFRAKNSFGGYVVYNMIFYLDSDGNVYDWREI